MTAKTAELVPATPQDPAVSRMQAMIEQNKPQMAALLGKHISVERLFQIALLALSRNPKLAQCTTASVLGCIMESSRLRLAPGAGAGATWLIPFENKKAGFTECTLIVDYRAVILMMKRDAGVEAVIAEAVHAKDKFDYGIKSDGPYLDWTPAKGDRGPVLGYVAASWNKAKALTGVIYKTIKEIEEQNKGKSMAAAKGEGPWKTDPEWMYKKSVLRPLGKLNPGTENDDLSRAIALDERAELGMPQNLHLLADQSAKALPDESTAKTYTAPPLTEKGEDADAKKVEWFREHTAKQGVPAEQFEAWAAQYPDDKTRVEEGKKAWAIVMSKDKDVAKTAVEAFAVLPKTANGGEGENQKDEKEARFKVKSVATSELDGDPDFFAIRDSEDEAMKYFSKDPAVVESARLANAADAFITVAYTDYKVGKKTVRIITRLIAAK